MPHFIIECSENVLKEHSPNEIMKAVYDAAEGTGLFAKNDIKVRICAFKYFMLAANKNNFIHVFGEIMEGRSVQQKATLSKQIVTRLEELFPDISFLSMNVSEFELATYCNKSLINPFNTTNDRHFEM